MKIISVPNASGNQLHVFDFQLIVLEVLFFKDDCQINVHATVSTKRKREFGLVAPASFSARTKNKKHGKIFGNKLVKRK